MRMENNINECIDEVIADINRQNSKQTGEVGSFVWGEKPDGRVYLGKIQTDGVTKITSHSKNKEEFYKLINYN